MRKIIPYLKHYWGYLLTMILLLLCQAIIDLNLPNLMSNIVNVGIQRNGISESAPMVIDEESLSLIKRFLADGDIDELVACYEKVDLLSSGEKENLKKKYPGCDGAYYLKSKDEKFLFSKACYALSHVLAKHEVDINNILDNISQEEIDEAISLANKMPVATLKQSSSRYIKSFYTDLGVDIGKVQNNYILKIGGKMLLLTLLLVMCAISVRFCTSRMGTGLSCKLRHDIFAKITTFTNNEFDKFGTASLITRTTNDVMQIRMMLSMGLRTLLYAPIMGIGGVIMALSKSSGMAWIIALACLVIMGIVVMLLAVAVPKFKIMQKLIDKLNLISRESLAGMMVIRAFANQDFEEERFAKANKELASNNLFIYRAMAVLMPTMTLVMNVVSLLIVWVGGKRIASSSMQVGDMMAFIQYAMQIIMSFLMISLMFVTLPRSVVAANRIKEVLECESSIKDVARPLHLPKEIKGIIEFKDVSFKYAGADANVLEHISFTAMPGETTAFIGSTGSGKSTLINLIPRFYDVTSGMITLDGIDISKLPQRELRDAVGYVPQKGTLFSGNIAENIRYGKDDAESEVIDKALKTAAAKDFVDKMPQGMQTSVSQGGTNVSGGQRQRLAIARALIKDAPVYIFDDTFSALDFKTEAKLRANLKETTEKKTVLIVAQRVSTIMNAEQIIVLDEGRAVGIGTHKELLANCKTYREIAESQLSQTELS